jgi:hypothetical protein
MRRVENMAKAGTYDKGYGLCPECHVKNTEAENRQMDKLISEVSESLNDVNRAKFAAMDRETQELFVRGLIEDGLITFEVVSRRTR